MVKFSLCALVYTNADGKKVRLKAHKAFDDASSADIEKWEKEGRVRDATIGEIAEAVAAGELDKEALPKPPSARKTEAASEKAADPAKPESKPDASQTAGKSDGAQTNGDGAPKRQDIV